MLTHQRTDEQMAPGAEIISCGDRPGCRIAIMRSHSCRTGPNHRRKGTSRRTGNRRARSGRAVHPQTLAVATARALTYSVEGDC